MSTDWQKICSSCRSDGEERYLYVLPGSGGGLSASGREAALTVTFHVGTHMSLNRSPLIMLSEKSIPCAVSMWGGEDAMLQQKD